MKFTLFFAIRKRKRFLRVIVLYIVLYEINSRKVLNLLNVIAFDLPNLKNVFISICIQMIQSKFILFKNFEVCT